MCPLNPLPLVALALAVSVYVCMCVCVCCRGGTGGVVGSVSAVRRGSSGWKTFLLEGCHRRSNEPLPAHILSNLFDLKKIILICMHIVRSYVFKRHIIVIFFLPPTSSLLCKSLTVPHGSCGDIPFRFCMLEHPQKHGEEMFALVEERNINF